jgi:hypothetical protein
MNQTMPSNECSTCSTNTTITNNNMMDATVQMVVKLNDAGLIHIRQGDYAKAAAFFHKATDCLDMAVPFDLNEDHEMTECDDGNYYEDLPIKPTPSLSSPQTMQEQPIIGIYDCGFFLSRHSITQALHSNSVRLYTSIALFFNLALCYHFQGMSCPSRQSVFLEEARCQYQVACGFLDSCVDQREALLLHFALINNLASVSAQLHDMVDARRWLDDLRFVYTSDGDALETEDKTVFLGNLVTESGFTPLSSPAA